MATKYTPYHAQSAAKAKELCKGLKTPTDKFWAVTKWITDMVFYDYIRASNPKLRKVYPDLDYVWTKKRGICLDTAALAVNMLRAVGIRAYVAVGHADKTYHAWAEATINGKTYLYDHQASDRGKKPVYKREHVYG